jgi:putative ABC transport system permease protein
VTRPLRLYALRLAARELRGGARGLSVFLACLVLGVAVVAGIGSLVAAVAAGISQNARQLLGGDAEVLVAQYPADPAERAFLEKSGRLSRVTSLRAMARYRDRQTLISLAAVDAAYPLYGHVALAPGEGLGAALGRRDGVFGAAVDRMILGRLGLTLGDRIEIGNAVFAVRAVVDRVPDALAEGLVLGPRVLIAEAALGETGLVQPGAIVTYRYRLRLPAGGEARHWAAAAHAAFPGAGWQIRTYAEAAPGLRRLVEQLGDYLSLVGLLTLLVGGVGVGNAVGFHIAGKTRTIAALKYLGASRRLVFAVYIVEIAALAALGISLGLALGALSPVAAAPLLRPVLPVAVRPGLYPAPLAVAAVCGLLTALVFSAWPLAGIGEVPAAALFRARVAPLPRRRPPVLVAATAGAALALATLVVIATPGHRLAIGFVAGAAAAFAVFRAVAAGIVAAGGRLGRTRRPWLRLGLANLSRPGAATVPVVLSLGLGLTGLVAIALVEANLAGTVERRIPAQAPALFFIDIQPEELAGFESIVRALPGARFEEVAMMRGRITRLNGVPVGRAAVRPDARWALDSDRGITYAAALPAGSRLAAGKWWPPDYHGPPLVSFDAALARGMGLKVGDTLSVDLFGREITARIASLRDIDWQRLGINFVMVFAPGTFEKAPQTHLAAVYLPQREENRLVARVTRAFPNVSAIEVGEALAAVDRLFGFVGTALSLTALAAVAAGALVLGGAVAASRHRRVYEAAVLKVLGATRGAILGVYLVELGLLGLATALVAAGVGTGAAYLVVTRLLGIDWQFLPGPVFATAAAATLLALAIGFAQTWRALAAPAAGALRNA